MCAVSTHQSALENTAPSPRYPQKPLLAVSCSQRRPGQKISFADPHGNLLLAPSPDDRHVCGPDAPIRAEKHFSIADISLKVTSCSILTTGETQTGKHDCRSTQSPDGQRVCGLEASIRARKHRSIAEISSKDTPCSILLTYRRPRLKLSFADPHGNLLLPPSPNGRHVCGLDAPVRARKHRSIAEISSKDTSYSIILLTEETRPETQARRSTRQPSACAVARRSTCVRSRRASPRSKTPLHRLDILKRHFV